MMMLFSVMDTKVGAFAAPFCCRTKGEAIRSFTEAKRDAQSMISKYPADYRLYHIGEFDEGQGIIQPIAPALVVGADEL